MTSKLLRLLAIGTILALTGCGMLIFAWTYADTAKRQNAVVGTITYVFHGRGTTYDYVFEVNGVRIRASSGSCHTALTPQGCTTGAPVLVFYDSQHLSMSRLQEFGAASRAQRSASIWMVSIGLLFISFYFIFKKTAGESADACEPVAQGSDDQPDVLHITPGR